MKKTNKLLPLLATALLLAGCSNTPKIKDKNNTIVKEDSDIVQNNYQDIFDDFYGKYGVEVSTNELLLKLAKQVLADSDNWDETAITTELTKKINKKFNEMYASSAYKKDGLFSEEKLAQSLRSAGYTIVDNNVEPFNETIVNLVGYNDLKDYLKYDYSDYIAEIEKDFYMDLMKTEYILSERAGSNSSYFKNKYVRRVQLFKFTPSNSADANKYAELFQTMIDAGIEAGKDLKTILSEAGGIEEVWKLQQLEDLAKDFALINKKAVDGVAVNDDQYPLPDAYKTKVAEFEAKYKNDSVYGYRDIYEHKNDFDANQITEVKDKNATYSNSGVQSIYKGYYEKQVAIITSSYLTELVATSDGTDVINSTVQDELEDLDKMYKESNFLDVYETGTPVFKSGSDYYIVYATAIKDDALPEDLKEAAGQLATVSSNVKNAIYFYLTKYTEEGKLEINNQDLYDHLNDLYSYGEDK